MKLRYETGIATMTQFLVLGMLNLISGVYSSIKLCVAGDDCLTNAFLNIIIFVMVGIGLAFIAAVGYAAQDKRSKRFSQVLIITEGALALCSLFIFQHSDNYLSQFISALAFGSAVWVSLLAFRLMRSGGGRITRTTSQRPRQRHKPTQE